MKTNPILRGRAGIFVLFFVALLAAGCGKSKSSTQSSGSSPAGKTMDRLDYNMGSLVGSYLKVGRTNAAWDEPATNALSIVASMLAGREPELELPRKQVARYCTQAVGAGCDDLMIRYLHARYELTTHRDMTDEKLAEALRPIEAEMEMSHYPVRRKFYVSLRTAEAIRAYQPRTNTSHEAAQLLMTSMRYARNALLEESFMPAEEAFQICHDLLEPVENIRNYYENFYFAVEKPLFQNWSNTAPALLIKGSFYVNYAWHARGNTTAAKVTEEGWKLFGERLEIAANALETAWKLDPSDGRIANEMLGVELGQGKGREREELWFKRAMALYTNNYDACHAKLTYLQPKWHGSAEAMLAFGKECVDSEVWGGRVPLILADAHEALAYYVPQAGRADFWKQPQVWRDVKAAYEKFFLLNPDAISWRHNYARYAFWCEAWDDLNKQIPLLGEVNYDYFGGREEYERMVRLGKERGGKTAGR